MVEGASTENPFPRILMAAGNPHPARCGNGVLGKKLVRGVHVPVGVDQEDITRRVTMSSARKALVGIAALGGWCRRRVVTEKQAASWERCSGQAARRV